MVKDSVVRGHHVYKTVWRPVIGQEDNSAVLLPQPHNFCKAQEKFLLLCYLISRMFLI